MLPLDKTLRSALESTVKKARNIAETAVAAVLEQLGVAEANPHAHLSERAKELRRQLRVHSRQLGDNRKPDGSQEIDRLVEEAAYEHWHRMLFARFLSENNLLMFDGTATNLEECQELAEDADVACEWNLRKTGGVASRYELAAKLAAAMLPQIFRPDSPSFELELPPEHQKELEKLLAGLEVDVFSASDSLGWVYQFWQADSKERINKSEVKIGARELPAVTQLFTEPYMVSFLLDNALGAWWAGKRLQKADWESAQSEEELRKKAAIDGVPLEYLRFVKTEEGQWQPASGVFEKWPQTLAELKMLDPSCGSGHFLVSVFLMLVPLRMELEGFSAREAVDAVLSQNIHGLELDSRCVELAAFALAMAAWKFPGAGGYRPLPELQIACSGLSMSVAKEEWRALALDKQQLALALSWMHDTFRDAPVLGSLLNPAKSNAAKIVKWEELSEHLQQALSQEQSEEAHEAGVVAQGLAKAATLLADKYTWVVTNVPYLSRGKQSEELAAFCEEHYPEAKNDLATVFLDRCLEFCEKSGSTSIVLPQNWLFLTSYKKFREKLLKQEQWNLIARLGPKGFTTPMWDFNVQLITISKGDRTDIGGLFGEKKTQLIRGVDVSDANNAAAKAQRLIVAEMKSVEQGRQLENPDARVVFEEVSGELLNTYANGLNGMHGADSFHYRFSYWEVIDFTSWHFFQCTHEETEHFGGKQNVFYWAKDGKCHRDNPKAYVKGEGVWGKSGVVVSMMRILPVTLYSGDKFDISCTPVIPHNPTHLPAIWCFCSSPEYNEAVRRIDQKLNVTNATLVKVPFDLDHWTKVAAEKYPHGLPQPYTNDPTQWIFHGHPCGSVIWDEVAKKTARDPLRKDATVLQVAVARLLGYRWPAELDPAMELAPEQREWVNKCERLAQFADTDGVVCIPAVRGEQNAADRLLGLLSAAYSTDWNQSVLSELLTELAYSGKTLDAWLRDGFFEQHCKLFENCPFIWHIWDGLSDGFSILVNYHKLDAKLLESLIYLYLGDWISTKKAEGAEEKVAAAEQLKKRLELILEGEAPYDIFVRWKPLTEQPIGWDPDLNDGVRLNIRPFLSVPDIKVKGAGVLRNKVKVDWKMDRGRDVESAPWFKVFNGDRINDHHLTLAEKRGMEYKG